jgi:hypothetical protein
MELAAYWKKINDIYKCSSRGEDIGSHMLKIIR